MNLLLRLLPKSLVARVFSLYLVSLLLFVLAGLGLFFRYQFQKQIEAELLSAEMMMSVAAQSVADSAVIGDYDTIAKTLERSIARSNLSQALFIDTQGGVVKAHHAVPVEYAAPNWLHDLVESRLFEINQNISIGGQDYGVMRVQFAADPIAGELWRLALSAFSVAIGAALAGMVLIRIPLRRWLGNFDRIRVRESAILSGSVDVRSLLDRDAPQEIRHTFDILSRAAGRLSAQREEAAVTLNAITDGVMTTDERNHLIYCNPAAAAMFGIHAQTSIGQDIAVLLPELAQQLDDADADKVRRIEVTTASSSARILDITTSVVQTADSPNAGHVLAFRDVSEQHALDQQLRRELQNRQHALESLRSVLNTLQSDQSQHVSEPLVPDDLNALTARVIALMQEREMGRRALDNQKFALDQHAIVSITDLDGTITYANTKFCEISGYQQHELLGANHRIVKSGEHTPELFAQMWETISHGRVWHGEVCNRNKSGGLYWVDATIVPLLGRDGLPEQYIAIRTDISVRKNMEAQLADQLRFVEVLLEATPTAIYLKDRAGRYLRFNKAFESLFGIDRADWIGKNVFDLVPGESAAKMHALDLELFSTGTVQTYEANFTHRKTGALREGLYWKAPLTNSSGEVTALVGTILDITERNRIEQELREAKLHAEAASQAKSDFLANMSHEIRTPMNGVIGMTDLALETPLSDVQREYLSIVKNSAHSLMVILNDILDFSKIEAGKLNIESVEFALPSTISQTLKSLGARAAKKGVSLKCQMDPSVPERALGDPVRLQQVLTNLCDNAIKFTSDGTVTVRARATALPADTFEIRIEVSDTGIGIAPEKQRSVFEAFNQADTSTTRQFGGTGLGLTICARLVELMGGTIGLESALGVGSTFHFTLRVKGVCTPESTRPGAVKSALPTQVGSVKILKILLVEDHPINQKLATTLLRKWGHQVTLANNGQEGVDLFSTDTWDLVLMDMQMPVMGGLDATRLIRAAEASGRRTPIVAMTANAMEGDKQACLQAGMDDHLAKPFNASALKAVLERFTTPLLALE